MLDRAHPLWVGFKLTLLAAGSECKSYYGNRQACTILKKSVFKCSLNCAYKLI